MNRIGKTAVSLIAACAVLGSASTFASAAPQGPWVLPASDLSVPGKSTFNPALAVAPDATTTAVWQRSDGTSTIRSATRPPGGSFGAPVDLSVSGKNAFSPQITTAPDGTATAVWRRFDGSNFIIQAATRAPGGSFGAPVNLSAAGQNASFPQITAAPDGTTTAVWPGSDGTNSIIQAATRPPGGSFGAPVDLSAAGQSALSPQIATAPDGTATVVWSRSDGTNSIIQAATRPPGGSFGTAVDLSAAGLPAGQGAVAPQIATAPDGTATVVWGRLGFIQAATRPPGGSFGAPVDLSASGTLPAIRFAAVDTAPDGTTTVIWRFNATSDPDIIIQAATRPPGGSFGSPVDLSAAAQDAGDPQITSAPDGTTTAIWYRSDGSNEIIQAATRPPGGGFGAPVNLSAPGQDAGSARIAATPDGTATAIWDRSDGTNVRIQSASTAQPSFLLQTERSGTGTGTVTSGPPGIDCGTDCAQSYPSFTEVTLTATPDAGSTFTGWSGAGCSGTGNCQVTVLEATSVTAEFTADPPPSDPPPSDPTPSDPTPSDPTPSDPTPSDPTPSAGKPRLSNLKIKPKSKKVRRGKKTTFKVRVMNTGEAAAKKLKVCVKGPKKLVKVPKCRKPGKLASGKSKTLNFKVRLKKRAKKGKKAKITFTANAKGAKKKSGKATVKIR